MTFDIEHSSREASLTVIDLIIAPFFRKKVTKNTCLYRFRAIFSLAIRTALVRVVSIRLLMTKP